MTNIDNNFLDLFQKFEKLLKEKTGSSDDTHFRDCLIKASAADIFLQKNYSLIEDLCALRNVFSHRERGKYIATVNDFALKSLELLTNSLRTPPTVISKFKVDAYQVDIGDLIPSVMQVMCDKTFTHVPVWHNKEFVGVFSYTSFFEWLAERQKKENREVTFTKKLMGDIDRKYLNSPCVNYQFISEAYNLYEIPPLFDEATKKSKRLDCLLITQNGNKGEKITGIITSWDLGSII